MRTADFCSNPNSGRNCFNYYSMADMNLQDYAAMRDLECQNRKGLGSMTALWVIAAVIVIAFFVYVWQKGCNEKVQFATGIAKLDGRVDALEPAVTAQGNNLYQLNGAFSATAQGVKDIKETAYNQLYELNDAVFYNPSRRGRGGCGGCGGREFKQTATYTLASQGVTVDETCRS